MSIGSLMNAKYTHEDNLRRLEWSEWKKTMYTRGEMCFKVNRQVDSQKTIQ